MKNELLKNGNTKLKNNEDKISNIRDSHCFDIFVL
jgi:hypothetical protein